MMIEEIKLLIEKNLPEQTAGALRKRLDLLDKLESENKNLKDELKSQMDVLAMIRKENVKLKSREDMVIAKEHDLEAKEVVLKEAEFYLEKKILEEKLDNANMTNTKIMELVDTVFKNHNPIKRTEKNLTKFFQDIYDPATGHTRNVENGVSESIVETKE